MLLVLSISIIVLVILLCIPPTRALIVVFFIKHFPSPIKIILAVAVVVAVVFTVLVLLGATLFWWFWSIYGSVLFVIAMLAIFSRWSPLAKLWLWRIVVIGLLLSLLPLLSPHYQSASNWLHEKLPALTEWQSTTQETVNTTMQESSLWRRGIIADSEVTKGSFGSISGSGVVGYDELGGEIPGLILSNGQPIKATGKTIAQNKKTGDEGMIQIMLPNKHGDFVGGRILWVTLRNATWKKQVAKEEEKVSVTPPTFVVTLPASVPPPPETKPAPAALVSPPKPINKKDKAKKEPKKKGDTKEKAKKKETDKKVKTDKKKKETSN